MVGKVLGILFWIFLIVLLFGIFLKYLGYLDINIKLLYFLLMAISLIFIIKIRFKLK
jgi:hypothetical protein